MVAFAALSCGSAASANSAEESIKLVQTASYNVVTGNWDVELARPAPEIADTFKRALPNLDYHLVDEDLDEKRGKDRIVLTFRGEGDQRVVVKLKELDGVTNVRIRVGALGSDSKSTELFKYVYERM